MTTTIFARRWGAAALAAAALMAGAMAPATAATQDKTLRLAVNQFPLALGNPYRGSGSPGVYHWAAVFDAPIWVDETGKPQPALAARWQNTSPTTWRVWLKPNVTFSNGEPVNADAVIANRDWLAGEEGKVQGNSAEQIVRSLVKFTKVDNLTFDVTTEKPDPVMASRLSGLYLVPPKYFKDAGVTNFTRKPIGTGPYVHQDWGADNHAKLEAWEGSWRPPKIRRVEMFKLEERAARLQAFLSKQVDIMQGVNPENFPQVEAAGGLIDISGSPQTVSMALFTQGVTADVKPIQDRRVRLAMNHAIDTRAYVDAYLRGFGGKASGTHITSTAQGYHALPPHGYDLNKAKALMAEAGYPNGGFELLIEGVIGGQPADSEIYQQVSQDIGKLGVKVNVRQTAFADYIRKLLQTQWEGHGYVAINATSPLNDAIQAFFYQSCLNPKPYYCDKSLEPLFQVVATEFDTKKRNDALAKIQEKYKAEAAHIMLHEIVDLTAVQRNVKNFKNRVRTFNFEDIEFAN